MYGPVASKKSRPPAVGTTQVADRTLEPLDTNHTLAFAPLLFGKLPSSSHRFVLIFFSIQIAFVTFSALPASVRSEVLAKVPIALGSLCIPCRPGLANVGSTQVAHGVTANAGELVATA